MKRINVTRELIGLIILSRAVIMGFLTHQAKAGTKNWANRVCWYRVNY
jgi:hypothetical protein